MIKIKNHKNKCKVKKNNNNNNKMVWFLSPTKLNAIVRNLNALKDIVNVSQKIHIVQVNVNALYNLI